MPKLNKKASRRDVRSPSLGSRSSRSPSPPSPDYEVCAPSDSPEEDYGENVDDEMEWPVNAIVGEEILLNREPRYQIEWGTSWKRNDGTITTTTWSETVDGSNDLLREWKKSRKAEKHRQMEDTPEINLATLDEYRPHNIHTGEDAVAFKEKYNKWCARPILTDWDKLFLEESRTQPMSEESTIPDLTRKRKRSESIATASRASSSRAGESDMTLVGSPGPSNKRSNSSRLKRSFKGTSNLQRSIDNSVEETGAARVVIVNEIDDDEVPPLVDGFKYLENKCTYDMGVPDPTENKLAIVGCDCVGSCKDLSTCFCLSEFSDVDMYGNISEAYDENGLFLFNKEEVVECNEQCSCSPSCRNRTSQKPREIPLEIFKTKSNGWGARPSVRIKKGTVLGIYTGKVIKRDAVKRLSAEERDYTFDLDARDNNDPPLDYYSVCAYAEGNWTRFVNHSCTPNSKVFSAVVDTVHEANMPYIVFVASKNIPARKEITINYNPKRKKGKKRAGETVCTCGSENCKEFF